MSASTPDLISVGRPVGTLEYLQRIWDRRDFILAVPLGQLKAQNQNTLLGNLWHVLNPVLTAGVYWFIFGVLFKVGRSGAFTNYAGYLVVGMFAFTYLSRSLMSGTQSVTANLSLIQQIRFPRAALPLSSTIVEFVSQGPALVALILLVLFTGESPSMRWLLMVPAIGIQTLFNLGLAFYAARATFHFRDVAQLLPYILRIWMYLSAMFFPLSFVTDWAAAKGTDWAGTLFQWNPAYLFMMIWRGALLPDVGPPIGQTPPWYWAAASLWAIAVCVSGFFYFRAREIEYSGG